ncbi:spermidine/putrescine ABC transporter substrate-binding protein [Spirochaetia bacterium]|nr:spermidine/putrescine ABC transporter substrate-binding protein [Spirochaetia bacterium]
MNKGNGKGIAAKGAVVCAAVLAAVMVLTSMSCAKKDGGDRLYIYNWTYYCPDSVIEKFEKEFGIRVIYDMYDTNEAMLAKLQSGGAGYDLVFPSADYISIMQSQGMLAKIDTSKIPNLVNIDPLIKARCEFDPDFEYHVPYYYGAPGIMVNTEKVPVFEKSFSVFERPDLKNRMVMLDEMRHIMGAALIKLGYSVNTRNPQEINAARDYIAAKWKPNLTKFDSEGFGKGYVIGDFLVVFGYYEAVLDEVTGNGNLLTNTEFFIPEEGGPAYLDGMCILKNAKNVEAAHQFINFIHRPDIYAEFTDYFGFPSTVNIPARELKARAPFVSEEAMLRTHLEYDVDEALDFYNEAWFNTIRIGE